MPEPRPARTQRFERRMSDTEALMWNVEKDPWLNPSGGTLTVLDRPIDVEHFRRQLAAAVAAVPRLRERVVPGFGRLSPPIWRPDPEFDLDYHIRDVALPPPGTMRQLLDLVAAVYQDPYDRTRPLWMYHVVSGLEGGAGALIWKIHHTVADGIGAGRLAEAYLHPTRQAPPPPEVDLDAVVAAAVEADRAGPGPSLVGAVADTVAHRARREVGRARRAVGEVAMWGADPWRIRDRAAGVVRSIDQVRSQLGGGGGGGGGDGGGGDSGGGGDGVSGSPLWRTRSRHRHFEVLSVPLADALAAARALGGTLNDWFVTGAVNGVIAYHDARDVALTSLRTSFVVSTRTDRAIGGNSFTPTRLTVPAGPMGTRERFQAISATMAAKRAQVSGQGMLAGLAGAANLLPTSLVTGMARAQAASMDFATSNLRGSKVPLYVSGARVEANYPFGPLAGTAFNLTALSYAGRLDMGLFVDPVAVEAPGDLRDDLLEAYTELLAPAP